MKKIIQTKYHKIEYNLDEKIKEKCFKALIEWYSEYELFDGETIMQNDNGLIEAPVVLSEIADNIIKFKYLED